MDIDRVKLPPLRLLLGIAMLSSGPAAMRADPPAVKSDSPAAADAPKKSPPAPAPVAAPTATPVAAPAPSSAPNPAAQAATTPTPATTVAPAPAPAPPTGSPAAKDAAAKEADAIALPKIEVTATRIKELDREIKRLDKAIAREKRKVKATDLDKVLNNEKLTKAASVFGGNSASYLEEVAATRVNYMETERELLADMKEPKTVEELALLQDELERVRTAERELDLANH